MFLPPACRQTFSARDAILRVGGALLLSALMMSAASAAPAASADAQLDADLAAARVQAGADVAATHAALARLREAAITRDRLETRLAADELDCRLMSDVDIVQARQLAQAGVGAAASAPARIAKDTVPSLALLRLRACNAGVLLDLGEQPDGNAELAAVLDASADQPALASAHALALLERGLHRSRVGELVLGQDDLIAACAVLEHAGEPRDRQLCLGHLANHYKRVGDRGEAVRLLAPLVDDARRRRATIDLGVYAYGLAQVLAQGGEWAKALDAFSEALKAAEATRDSSGIGYAEYGIGQALAGLGQPLDASDHVARAKTLIATTEDAPMKCRVATLEATLLAALDRPAEAAAALARTEHAVRELHDDVVLAEWLAPQARAQARLGHWHEAYDALAAWSAIDGRVQAQRQSEQSARLRVQFNRERDADALQSLREINQRERRLRQMQALALALFVVLLAVAVAYAVRKMRQARRLHTLAMNDELTGLPNRRAVLAHAESLRRRARHKPAPLSALMIDVDHFKRINDTYGHAVGDDVLCHLARVLAASLRPQDRAGRLGGEEFLVVLPATDSAQAMLIAERLRERIATSPCSAASTLLPFTASIGVATADNAAAQTVAALLERADTALYAAKAGGRNRVACSDAVTELTRAESVVDQAAA